MKCGNINSQISQILISSQVTTVLTNYVEITPETNLFARQLYILEDKSHFEIFEHKMWHSR